MKSFSMFLVIVLISVLVQACSDQTTQVQPEPVSGDLGKVSLAFDNPPQGVTEVVATLTRTPYPPRILQLTISDSTFSANGSFSNVTPGVWHLRVEALDSSHVVLYSGETDVNVVAGQTAQVSLQLVPGSGGGIEIHVTWGTPGDNLLVNGSFEQGPWVGTYLPIDSGSTAIDGWVVSRQEIDIVVYWLAYDGDKSIDLNGSPGRGGIKQTFATNEGTMYRVTFAMAGNPEGMTPIMRMGVSAAGSSTEFSFDIAGKSITDMGWQTKTWTFVATGQTTTLEFYSLMSPTSWFGPAIDNVSVVAVH